MADNRKTPSDHVLAVVKAGINVVPVVGGPLANLIGDYVPNSTQRAAVRTMELLAEKLSSLEDRIDVQQVDKEEFSELFKSCSLVVIRSHREEKLRVAAALLANLLLRPSDAKKSPYEELDHLVRCLETLSVGAIAVLGASRHITAAQANFNLDPLRNLFPEFDTSLLMSLVRELENLNLLRVQEGNIRMSDHGELLLELTPIGRRFVERFIEGDM